MEKHSTDSDHSRELILNRRIKKVKTDFHAVKTDTDKAADEIARLQKTVGSIQQMTDNRNLLNVINDVAINARLRLNFIHLQLVKLSGYGVELDLITKKIRLAKSASRIHLTKFATAVSHLHRLIGQEVHQIKRKRLQNQLALAKINQVQWFLTIPKHDLGCIELLYVDAHNHVIKRQTELGRIGQSFNLMTHLTALPDRYHFVKVIIGQRLMIYRPAVQRTVIKIAKNPTTVRSVSRHQPKVALDTNRPGRIRLIYLNSQGQVIRVHDTFGTKGAAFGLNQAMHLPNHYDLVRVISGLNVKRYQQRTQLIEIEIKFRGTGPKCRINPDRVRQAFLDYYNARIMNVTPQRSDYSANFGYRCAQQYLIGVADAYHGKSKQENSRLYQRGYQTYLQGTAKKLIKTSSFSDVLLTIYGAVIRDITLLDHDLKRDSVDF